MSDPRPILPSQCVGEIIHKDVDFQDLMGELNAVEHTPEARLAFAAQRAPGSATLGLIEASNVDLNLTERCGAAIETLLASEQYKNKTGVEIGLNHTPAMVLTDTFKQLIMSSDVLTPAKVDEVRKTVKAKGGCKISVLYQAHRMRGGAVAGSHVEVVITPDNDEDGPELALSLVLTLPDDGKWKNARSIIQQLTGCDELAPPAPEGNLAKAFCGPEGTRIFGPDNVLLVLPRKNWAATLAEYLARNKLETVNIKPDCALRVHTHPTEARTTYTGDDAAMSVYKQLAALSDFSIGKGRLLSFGSHLGMNSCITNAGRLLECALPDRFTDQSGRFVPAKTLIDRMVEKADGHFRATKKDARINEFDDPAVFEPVSADDVRKHLNEIWEDENMHRQLSADSQDWSNMYDHYATPHKDEAARQFYLTMGLETTHLLESMADEIAPPHETPESLMAKLGLSPVDVQPKLTKPAVARSGTVDYVFVSPEEEQDFDAFLAKAIKEMEKPSQISDEEVLKWVKKMTAVLDASITEEVTQRYGAEASQRLTRQRTRTPGQLPGDVIVQQLQTIQEIMENAAPGESPPQPEAADDDSEPSTAAREQVYRAVGIALKHFPEHAEKIKALCWLLFSDPLKIGLGLMVFWQSIRYAFSEDGGRTASLGPEIGGVLLFVALMPELEKLVNRLAMTTGGHISRVAPLTYPRRLVQELPQALFGGHVIGWTMSLIPAVAEGSNVPTRLSSELGRLVPGLCTVAGLNYMVDVYFFHQQMDHLQTDGRVIKAMLKDLRQSGRDLLTLRHWLTVRGPLAIALGTHRQTTAFWFNIFDKNPNERVQNLVGGSQFATFYFSVKILTMLGGLPYDIQDPRVIKIAPWLFKNSERRVAEVEGEDEV